MRDVMQVLLRALVHRIVVEKEETETALNEKKCFDMAKEIAEQIWREQQITSYRMNWLLTFQGFLLTSSGLTFTSLATTNVWASMLIRLILAFGGISTSLATWQSIRASQLQRDYLKKIWFRLYPAARHFAYPQPFSVDHTKRGRRAALWIVVTIIVMWAALAAMAIYFGPLLHFRDVL